VQALPLPLNHDHGLPWTPSHIGLGEPTGEEIVHLPSLAVRIEQWSEELLVFRARVSHSTERAWLVKKCAVSDSPRMYQ
jgi:hypothetical protein